MPAYQANNPVLYNNAAAGFCAGVMSKKLHLVEVNFSPIEPADFLDVVTAAFLFAQAVDQNLLNQPSLPTSVTSLTSGELVTVVPGSGPVANAAESLTGALVFLAKAAWEGRGLPFEAGGVPFTVADYAEVANQVVEEFLEFASVKSNV
jgi:hypothetical protein